jgi:hypothetical protein
MPVSSRVSTVSVRPFQIRPAAANDMDQLCELAAQLLTNIRAEGTTTDARRVFDYIMKAAAMPTPLTNGERSSAAKRWTSWHFL